MSEFTRQLLAHFGGDVDALRQALDDALAGELELEQGARRKRLEADAERMLA